MLNLEDGPTIAAAGVAADIASRLGLVEAAADARITVATARYGAGDRSGLAELREVEAMCREQRLLARRRATRNLAYLLLEEGDWAGYQSVLRESGLDLPAGHNIATGFSEQTQQGYFDGDWGRLAGCAEELASSPSGEWDLQARAICLWITLLRGEPVAEGDIAGLVAAGRRSGFHRLLWVGLGQAAFCHALRGEPDRAAELLTELADSWQKVHAIASGEWLHAAAHSAVIVGRPAAVALRELLADGPHRTPWVEAALHSVTGAVAAADGDRVQAAALHRAAADIYGKIPNRTDRILALAAAVRADPSDQATATELRAFAAQHRAPGLLTLAAVHDPGGDLGGLHPARRR
jgi:hypothetical protein